MKAVGVILLAVVSSAATVMLLQEDATPSKAPRAHAELDALRREQAALRAELEALRTRPPVEEVVVRVLEEREAGPAPRKPAPDIRGAMAMLLDRGGSVAERRQTWDAVIAQGGIDAVVAEFERRAAASPRDSMAHFELGVAYHQRMRTAKSGVETGKWGQKGSDAYQKALELDETNWDARFAQAQHFFWAEMKGDSLRHLEILRKQQAGRAPEAKHAGVFLFLGNLYLDTGNKDEARKVWSEGLQYFPANERLRALLDTLDRPGG